MADEEKRDTEDVDPSIGWDELDELYAATGFRPVFRYRKADRTRTYRWRMRPNYSAELWVNAEGGGRAPKSRRLLVLTNSDDVAVLVESIEQELRAGGWIETEPGS